MQTQVILKLRLLINCYLETSILKLQRSQSHYRSRVSPSPDSVNIVLKTPEVQKRSFRTQVTGYSGRTGAHRECPVASMAYGC